MRSVAIVMALFLCVPLMADTNTVVAVQPAATNTPPAKVAKSAKAPTKVRRQCEAKTLSGNRCKRNAAEGSRYCRQHEAIMRRRETKKDAKGK